MFFWLLFKFLKKKDLHLLMWNCFFAFLISVIELLNIALIVDLIEKGGNKSFHKSYVAIISEYFGSHLFILGWLILSLIIVLLSYWVISIKSSYLAIRFQNNVFQTIYNAYKLSFWSRLEIGYSFSDLITISSTESQRVVGGVINPFSQILSKLPLMIAILTYSLFEFSLQAIFPIFLAVFFYTVIFYYSRKLLSIYGKTQARIAKKRMGITSDYLKSFKELEVFNVSHKFLNDFKSYGSMLIKALARTQFLIALPKNIIETSFGFIVILFSFIFFSSKEIDPRSFEFLAIIIISLRTVPIMQQIFNSIATIRNNLAPLEDVKKINDYVINNLTDDFDLYKSNNNPKFTFENHDSLLLSVKNLSFKVGRESLITNLSFNAYSKDITFISGKSGTGKTTLLNILIGLTKSDTGTINFKINNNSFNPFEARNLGLLGYLDQKVNILNGSWIENVFISRMNLNSELFTDLEYELSKILEEIGLNKLRNFSESQNLEKLSGGEAQRLGFARVIASEAKFLFLDEPTSSLDKYNRLKLTKILLRFIDKGFLILIVSHDQDFIASFENKKIINIENFYA